MHEIIEKLGAGTGPDRVIDGLIFKAIEHRPGDIWTDQFDGVWYRQDPEDAVAYECPPLYTACLDEAMMLVPEGWCWMAGRRDYPMARAYVNNGELHMSGKCKWFESTAPAPALALCIAALKARCA